MIIAQKGLLDILSLLLQGKANINQVDKNDQNALFHAVNSPEEEKQENVDIVSRLIDEKCDLNKQNNNGETPLFKAC